MTVDSGTLARLVALGRAKGQLTNADLEDALPVASMSPDDIALVVVHLEEAGVPVELDESLLGGQPSRPPDPVRPAEFVAREEPARAVPPPPGLSPSRGPEPAATRTGRDGSPPGPSVHRAVALAGLAVLALLLVAVLLIRS
ncbi:MAG TPA: RNA polymerase sigma factor region1.1 domain-containing protein [Microvirga sp.]|jgi:hypothetical protein|nr:RNA polymerase sigma factor region1.1 domain-containing protein [Microvirga sp.]